MRKYPIGNLYSWFLLGVCVLLCTCSDDDYHYPSVKLEFLTAYSDAEGGLQYVVTDEGDKYPVWAGVDDWRITPDSLIRIVSNYEIMQTDGVEGVRLYSALAAVSSLPLPAESFEGEIMTDPADVLSIWMGRDYLNMMLEVKAQNRPHEFFFVEESRMIDVENHHASVSLLLYHDDGDDIQAYTKRAYCSVPLRHYVEEGVETVTVHFSVYTYSGEVKKYEFEYKPL